MTDTKMVEFTKHKISLTEKEQKLFETLLAIIKEKGLKTTLRCAGGWVRDKVRNLILLT